MGSVSQAILQLIPIDGVSIGDLHTSLGVKLRRQVPNAELESALRELEAKCAVTLAPDRIKRSEPDAPERDLEADTLAWLKRRGALARLGFRRRAIAIERTASGGATGAGVYSNPDFTVVLAQPCKASAVTVVTLELKNFRGANTAAVMQARAHLAFSHYSFLVCPRPQFWPLDAYEPRPDCRREGVGLVTFEIAPARSRRKAQAYEKKLAAKRHRPDPADVKRYLRDKLPGVLEQTEHAGASS